MTPSNSLNDKILNGFWDETAKGVANVLVKVETAWYGENSEAYKAERQNLEKYTRTWKYGLASTCLLFLNFRITGSKRFIRWRENWTRQNGLNSTATRSSNKLEGQWKQEQKFQMGYLERKREKEVKEAMESMKIVTDLLVSISFGVSGAFYLLHCEKDSMRGDFESAPLVSGRSVVADEMCAGMISIYDSCIFRPGDRNPNMETFRIFVQNCKKRAKFEQDARALAGKPYDEPIIVPENVL